MENFDVVHSCVWNADPKDKDEYEILEGSCIDYRLPNVIRDAAHRYVLWNNTLTIDFAR